MEEGYKPHEGFRQKEEIRREGEFKVSVSRSLAQKLTSTSFFFKFQSFSFKHKFFK